MKSQFLKSSSILIICLFLLSCNNTKKLDLNSVNANFYIGGLFGTSYIVTIKNQQLTYLTRRGNKKLKEQKQTISIDDIKQLENKLLELGANQWRKKYINSHVSDGTHWGIKYTSSTLHINSQGSNLYPDNFEALTQYISQTLLKGKTFQ